MEREINFSIKKTPRKGWLESFEDFKKLKELTAGLLDFPTLRYLIKRKSAP